MKLNLFVVNGCPTCTRTETLLKKIELDFPSHQIIVSDISSERLSSVPIVPDLFIEDKLFSYGDMDLNKLEKYLIDLQKEKFRN